jgi:hypothetical protein
MTALDAVRHPHPTGKLLQIARHRVSRWFRPPEAELRRARLQPHPLPVEVMPARAGERR